MEDQNENDNIKSRISLFVKRIRSQRTSSLHRPLPSPLPYPIRKSLSKRAIFLDKSGYIMPEKEFNPLLWIIRIEVTSGMVFAVGYLLFYQEIILKNRRIINTKSKLFSIYALCFALPPLFFYSLTNYLKSRFYTNKYKKYFKHLADWEFYQKLADMSEGKMRLAYTIQASKLKNKEIPKPMFYLPEGKFAQSPLELGAISYSQGDIATPSAGNIKAKLSTP